MKPVILITGGFNVQEHNKREYTINTFYAEALNLAGAQCFGFCGGDEKKLSKICDGLLLSGGGDINPSYFGEKIKYEDLNINDFRDEYEMKLIDEFAKQNKPIFGVCRGMQLINVYFGGTLFQDIQKSLGISHSNKKHSVVTAKECILRKMYGKRILVNSFHHQAIKTVGKGFNVGAVCDDDGIIEAIFHENRDVFGVQWHPERMIYNVCMDTLEDMLDVFRYFVERCM